MVIIKSNSKKSPNWSGKEFSNFAAKIYSSFEDATQALSNYWFCEGAKDFQDVDEREVRIIHLSDKKKEQMMANGSIRW